MFEDEKTVDQIYKENPMKTSLDDIEPAVDQNYEQNGLMMTTDAEKKAKLLDQQYETGEDQQMYKELENGRRENNKNGKYNPIQKNNYKEHRKISPILSNGGTYELDSNNQDGLKSSIRDQSILNFQQSQQSSEVAEMSDFKSDFNSSNKDPHQEYDDTPGILKYEDAFLPIKPFYWNYIKPKDNKVRENRPKHVFENGAYYKGEWIGNKRDGRGIQKWYTGQIYEGQWEDDKAQGYGRMTNPDGDVYEGQWLNNMGHGVGIFVQVNGSKFKGQFKEDKQQGFGIEEWRDGAKYRGYYLNGMKHGKGKFTWFDKSVYEGDFFENEMEGDGVQSWPDGRRYTGSWKGSMMDGLGEFIFADGRRYKGQYQNNVKHGYGIFEWPNNGKRYEGHWLNGKQHGQGKLIKNDKVQSGIWEYGKLKIEDSNQI